MTLIGLPSTLPPKSSIAICAAVTEPWPVGVEAGPFMSVSTPILTTSSDTWACANVDASIVAANTPSIGILLPNIMSPPGTAGSMASIALNVKHSTACVNAAIGLRGGDEQHPALATLADA